MTHVRSVPDNFALRNRVSCYRNRRIQDARAARSYPLPNSRGTPNRSMADARVVAGAIHSRRRGGQTPTAARTSPAAVTRPHRMRRPRMSKSYPPLTASLALTTAGLNPRMRRAHASGPPFIASCCRTASRPCLGTSRSPNWRQIATESVHGCRQLEEEFVLAAATDRIGMWLPPVRSGGLATASGSAGYGATSGGSFSSAG